MKIENFENAHDITKKSLEIIIDKFDEVHIHDPKSSVEGLDIFYNEEDVFKGFNFFEEDEEPDCRDILWIKSKIKDSEFREIITIGKEPKTNNWSMDWCILEDGEFCKREFAYRGNEEKVLEHVLWLMKAAKMPED